MFRLFYYCNFFFINMHCMICGGETCKARTLSMDNVFLFHAKKKRRKKSLMAHTVQFDEKKKEYFTTIKYWLIKYWLIVILLVANFVKFPVEFRDTETSSRILVRVTKGPVYGLLIEVWSKFQIWISGNHKAIEFKLNRESIE